MRPHPSDRFAIAEGLADIAFDQEAEASALRSLELEQAYYHLKTEECPRKGLGPGFYCPDCHA